MSKALFSNFATDKNTERDGVLINYGDVRIKVARAGGANRKFAKTFQNDTKPYERQMKANTLSDGDSDRLMAGIYAKSVILGWETNFGTDEKPDWRPTFTIPASKKHGRDADEVLDFNEANVVRALLLLPELFADLREQATLVSNFREEDEEADAKN